MFFETAAFTGGGGTGSNSALLLESGAGHIQLESGSGNIQTET
jgi:hypothetical protein